MSKLKKRLTALLLSGMLVIGSVPGSVFAASTDVDPGQTSEIAQEVNDEEMSDVPAASGETTQVEDVSETPADIGEGCPEEASGEEEAAVQYYVVTLDANGGYFENEWDDAIGDYARQAEVVEKHIPVDGAVAAFPVYTDQDGQTMIFAGWSLERDGELVSQEGEEYIPVDNCVLYAVWVSARTDDAALGETAEQESADEDTELARSVQESKELEDVSEDTLEEEVGNVGEDTASETNAGSETVNEQDNAYDQEVYPDEDTESITEGLSESAATEEEVQSEVNDSSEEEEETVKEDAANSEVAGGTFGENNFTWTLDNEGTLTISGSGDMDTWGGSPWYSNYRQMIKKIIVLEGVTSIDTASFSSCAVEEVSLPEGLTRIGTNAFANCSLLPEIKLPESLVSLGERFLNGTAVTTLEIPKNLTTCSAGAVYLGDKSGPLAGSNVENLIFEDGITRIPDNICLGERGLEQISLDPLRSAVKNVWIPASVKSIGKNAFCRCDNLNEIYYSGTQESWEKIVIEEGNEDLLNANYHFKTGVLTVDPEYTCTTGMEITVSATYKGPDTITSIDVKPDDESAMEIGEVSIGAPIGTGDDAETLISFPLTAKKEGEYNLALTASDGTTASTVVKAKGIEITLEDQTIYDDDESYIINADIRSPQAPTADDLTWTLTRNNISYKNSIKEVIIETDERDSTLYHIKQRISLIHWGVYSLSLTYGEKKKEADLTMLHGKPLVSKVKSGKHRELIIDWNYGLCGMASGYRIKFADNRELKNAVVYEMGASPCDNSSGKIQMIDGDEDSFFRFTSKKPMKRGAKLYVRLCCMADTKEGKWSDLTEVQIGKQILSEEFFGMANTDVVVDDLAGTDLDFLKEIFDDGVAKLLYDRYIAEETAGGNGDGSNITLGGGICYGMDVAAIAAYSHGFPSDLYRCNSLYEIDSFSKARESHSSETSISAEDMIRYSFFLQYADLLKNEEDTYWLSENPLLDLVNKVRACEKGTGAPPLILIGEEGETKEGLDYSGEDDIGHALVGICISEDNEDETIVEVYNPCYPGEHTEDDTSDQKQYYSIHITKTNGEYTGWSFRNDKKTLFEGELSTRTEILDDDCLMAVGTSLHTEALKKIAGGERPFLGEQKYVSWCYLHYVDQTRIFDFTDDQYERYLEEKNLSEIHPKGELADSSVNTSVTRLWLTTLDEIPLCFYEEGNTASMAQGQYYLKAIAGGRTDCTISQSSDHPGYVSFTPVEDALQTAIFNGRINDINETEQTVVEIRTPVGRTGLINENEDGTFTIKGVTFFDWKRYAGTMQGDNTIDDQTPDTVALDNLDPDSTYSISANEDTIIVNEDKDNDGHYDDTVSEIPLRNLIASGECGENLTWSLDEAGVLFISGTGSMANYFNQGTSPFSSYEVKKVLIKKGVTSIGIRAFDGQSGLTSVQIPESVTDIEGWAFKDCSSLTSITIPEGVRLIDSYVFSGCSSLTDVTVPGGVTWIDFGAFRYCSSLTSITIPEGVEVINNWAFEGCSSLTSVTIPDSVRSINFKAFSDCTSLTRVQLPETMPRLRTKAFHNTLWLKEKGDFPTIDGILIEYQGQEDKVVIPDDVTIIGDGAFYENESLVSITIPDGVTGITDQAFNSCRSLKSITIPSSVASIESYVFDYCNSLESLTISEGVTMIGAHNFWDCSNLKSITIPESVTDINDYAFHRYPGVIRVHEDSYAHTFVKELGLDENRIVVICKNHSWNTDYTIDKQPTYTEEGMKSIHCSICDEIRESSKVTLPRKPKPISLLTITGITSKTYNGKAQTQAIVVKDGTTSLKKGTDYTVSYKNNINAGTASAVITGKGNYTGTVSKNFTISAASIANATVTGISSKTYTGSALTQNPAVKVGDRALTKGTDYTLSFANNTNVGTATVTITGKGNYVSKKNVTFKINKAVQSITAKAAASSVAVGKTTTVSITGAKGTKSYKSSDTTIAAVTSAGKVTAKKVGTVKITATSAATSNYNAASKTVTIKVVPAATTSLTAANQATGIKLTWRKVTGANGYKVYRGSTLIKTITSGSTVTFADAKANTNGTKYTYKVVAKASTGDSTLSKSVAVYRVARPAVSSVTNSAASKMTVKWGKNAKATGYQIQYSTDKTFKSGNKAVTVTGAATVSKVIGSLTKGKTYYVRIRTYKTVGSAKYWSIWSAARSVKISK